MKVFRVFLSTFCVSVNLQIGDRETKNTIVKFLRWKQVTLSA